MAVIMYNHFMRKLLLILLILVTRSQTCVPNCHVADLVDSTCLLCVQGYQLFKGACSECLSGYRLVGKQCLPNPVLSLSVQAAFPSQSTTGGVLTLHENPCISIVNEQCGACISGFRLQAGQCLKESQKPKSNLGTTPNIAQNGLPSASSGPSSQTTSSQNPNSPNQTTISTSSPTNIAIESPQTSLKDRSGQSTPVLVRPAPNSTLAQNNSSETPNGTKPQTNLISSPPASPESSESNTQIKSSVNSGGTIGFLVGSSQTKKDPNCKQSFEDITFCKECYPSFYYDYATRKCEPTNPLCREVLVFNFCKSCFDGYILTNNGQCVVSRATTTQQNPTIQQNTQGNSQLNQDYSQPSQPSTQTKTNQQNSQPIEPNRQFAPQNSQTNIQPVFQPIQPLPHIIQFVPQSVQPNLQPVSSDPRPSRPPSEQNPQSVQTNLQLNQASPSPAQASQSNQQPSVTNQKDTSEWQKILPYVYMVSSNDINCRKHEGIVCTECFFRYYLSYQGCTIVDGNCRQWNIFGYCLSCYVGYVPVNGRCLTQQQADKQFPNGAGIQNMPGTSINCPFRSVKIGSQCVQVNDLCKTWSEADASCTGCYQGYKNQNGKCIIQ